LDAALEIGSVCFGIGLTASNPATDIHGTFDAAVYAGHHQTAWRSRRSQWPDRVL
jgi:hypothetical protein